MSQTNGSPNPKLTTGTPRWVKVLGIIVIVLVLLFITLHLAGIGPMNHMPSTQQGVQQP